MILTATWRPIYPVVQIWGSIIKKEYRFPRKETLAATENPKREWQRRLEVNVEGKACLEAMVYPSQRHNSLLRLMLLGEDIKDMLHEAVAAEGPHHIGSRYWAHLALARIQADYSTRAVSASLAAFQAQVATEGESSFAAAVICYLDCAIEIAALIDPGCLDVRQYVKHHLDSLGPILRKRLMGMHPGSLQAVQELGTMLLATPDESGKPFLSGNREDYYAPESSLVHRVLERGAGIPISLSNILAAVAERGGMTAAVVEVSGRFLTRFPITHGPSAGEDRWICAFDGSILTKDQVVQGLCQPTSAATTDDLTKRLYESVAPRRFVETMVHNLLQLFIKGDPPKPVPSVAAMRFLSRLFPETAYIWETTIIQAEVKLGNFETVFEMIRDKPEHAGLCDHLSLIVTKQGEGEGIRLRVAGMEFRVGDVVRHVKYGYRGVIGGWDLNCQATSGWVDQTDLKDLTGGIEQPFYQTLVDSRDRPGDQSAYVAQENLELLPRQEAQTDEDYLIRNEQVPELFDGMTAGASRYTPNRFRASQFPQD